LSNGQSYTQLQGNAPVIVETKVVLDVEVSGSIVSWWVQPEFQTGVGMATEVGGMWFSRHSESYPFGSRPNKVNKIVDLSVAASTLEDEAYDALTIKPDHPTGACHLRPTARCVRSQAQQRLLAIWVGAL